jgi:beta-lactamase regulating signal transducer with metallopeptidase domain
MILTDAPSFFVACELAFDALSLLFCKSLFLLGLGVVLTLLLRQTSAALRHWAWTLTFSGLILLPVLSFVLPAWNVPVQPIFASDASSSSQVTTRQRSLEQNSLNGSQEVGAVDNRNPHASVSTAKVVAVIVWSLGVVFLWLRLFLGVVQLRRFEDRTLLLIDARLKEIASELDPKGRIDWRQAPEAGHIPLTWGWRRPVILLSQESREWSPEQSHSVMQHELCHVRRRDWVIQIATQMICALYWANPLVWVAQRRLQTEAELACDDAVLSSGVTPHQYARDIVEVTKTLGKHRIETTLPVRSRTPTVEGSVR